MSSTVEAGSPDLVRLLGYRHDRPVLHHLDITRGEDIAKIPNGCQRGSVDIAHFQRQLRTAIDSFTWEPSQPFLEAIVTLFRVTCLVQRRLHT